MTLTAVCHCGATHIEFDILPTSAKTCNCSFCRRTGAVWAYFEPETLRVIAAENRVYSSGGLNKHYFCGRCGGNTHGSAPDWSSAYDDNGKLKPGMAEPPPEQRLASVNLNMVDDLDLSRVTITAVNGRDNW